MHILVFLLISIVAVFVMALADNGNIIRAIFGLGRRNTDKKNKRKGQYTYNSTNQQQKNNSQQQTTSHTKTDNKQGKVFTEDEGEYVDFEEIKD